MMRALRKPSDRRAGRFYRLEPQRELMRPRWPDRRLLESDSTSRELVGEPAGAVDHLGGVGLAPLEPVDQADGEGGGAEIHIAGHPPMSKWSPGFGTMLNEVISIAESRAPTSGLPAKQAKFVERYRTLLKE